MDEFELRIRADEKETEISCSGDGEDLLDVIADLMIWAGQCCGMEALDVLENVRDLLEDDGKKVAEIVRADEDTIRKALEKMRGEDDG